MWLSWCDFRGGLLRIFRVSSVVQVKQHILDAVADVVVDTKAIFLIRVFHHPSYRFMKDATFEHRTLILPNDIDELHRLVSI